MSKKIFFCYYLCLFVKMILCWITGHHKFCISKQSDILRYFLVKNFVISQISGSIWDPYPLSASDRGSVLTDIGFWYQNRYWKQEKLILVIGAACTLSGYFASTIQLCQRGRVLLCANAVAYVMQHSNQDHVHVMKARHKFAMACYFLIHGHYCKALA